MGSAEQSIPQEKPTRRLSYLVDLDTGQTLDPATRRQIPDPMIYNLNGTRRGGTRSINDTNQPGLYSISLGSAYLL